LNNIPSNALYRFRVIIYDQFTNKWSEFSDPSSLELNMMINLSLSVERIGLNSLKCYWNQLGTFNKYHLSRFNIQVSNNEQPFIDNYDNSNLNTSKQIENLGLYSKEF
jgi:hypothetical protein